MKTGVGGGNATASSTGGNAGYIILQPGSGGSGTGAQGAGGSTIVRAANSGDILAVQNSAGSTTHLGVNNSGHVRIGTASSGALLQLGAGTTTLPPLKLTTGTLLTSPSAGAIEWDGSKLWISSGSLRKELTLSQWAVVTDFGAKGDGTDDGAAIQAAVSSLADLSTPGDGNGTGGVVYFPPNKLYGIGSTVEIRSYNPIFIVSEMSTVSGFYNTFETEGLSFGFIRPLANLSFGIFRWREPSTEPAFDGQTGGGGAIGLVFADPGTPGGGATQGTKALPNGAIYFENALTCSVRNCGFWYLKGTAIRTNQTNICEIDNVKSQRCGDTSQDEDDPVSTLATGRTIMGSGSHACLAKASMRHTSWAKLEQPSDCSTAISSNLD